VKFYNLLNKELVSYKQFG